MKLSTSSQLSLGFEVPLFSAINCEHLYVLLGDGAKRYPGDTRKLFFSTRHRGTLLFATPDVGRKQLLSSSTMIYRVVWRTGYNFCYYNL